jgi:hypothetical protein
MKIHNQVNKNYLPKTFYVFSSTICKAVLTREQLHETLLATDGIIYTHGEVWDICSQDLGADIYKVWLEKQK